MKYTKEIIKIQQLPSGDFHSLIVHKFKGTKGPKVYLQANIHAPEIAGTPVLLELVKLLKKQTIKGEIIVVASAGPIGLNSKISGFPVGTINLNGDSTKNWNRIFLNLSEKAAVEKFVTANKKLSQTALIQKFTETLLGQLMKFEQNKYGINIEKKLAVTVQKLSYDADYVLDIHSAGLNQAHIYSFSANFDSIPVFGIESVLILPTEFSGAFDESFNLPWLSLSENYLQLTGQELVLDKEAFTLELPNDNEVSDAKTNQYLKVILNYLVYKKIIPTKYKSAKPKKFNFFSSENYLKYYAPKGGLVEPLVAVGQTVKKGTPLVKIISLIEDEPTIIKAQNDCLINSFPLSKVVSEGEPVVGVLEKVEVKTL